LEVNFTVPNIFSITIELRESEQKRFPNVGFLKSITAYSVIGEYVFYEFQ